MSSKTVNLMEVCGTHTMAVAKSGLKSLLPENIRLISGPGCPVCVTPPSVIDAVLSLSGREGVVLATYGDMVRVPGSRRGDSLRRRMAEGARVQVVYSPFDAVKYAAENPGDEVVFLGVGFETSAPGTAAAVGEAERLGLKNFSVFSMLKIMEPPIRALVKDPDFNVQGFLCPGHVASVIGEEGLRFIAEDLHLPAVIAGFETADILKAVRLLLLQAARGEARLENAYERAVRPEGNPKAREIMRQYFVLRDDDWRGLGNIPGSGLMLRDEYEAFDAEKRFSVEVKDAPEPAGCRCGSVIRGKEDPACCPLFGKVCTPEDPVGPCMVSSEGACAAAFRYREA